MIKEEEKLDKLFREKLEGLEINPPDSAWDGIQQKLKNKNRGKVVLFYRIASAAAVILIALMAGWLVNQSSTKVQPAAENKVPVPGKLEEPKTISAETVASGHHAYENAASNVVNTLAPETLQASGKRFSETLAGTGNTTSLPSKREDARFKLLAGLDAILEEIVPSEWLALKSKAIYSGTGLTGRDRELIARNISNFGSEKNSSGSWEVGFRVSPGYSSQKSEHAESYRQSMTYSNAEGNADLNGGLSVNYKTGKRWSLESGVYYSRNGQSSGNSLDLNSKDYAGLTTAAEYFNTPVIVKQGQMAMNSTAGVIKFSKTPGNVQLLASLDAQAQSANTVLTASEFQQVFDFIEIPVYLRYNVIDSKVDVDLLGGLSANWLVGNNVYMDTGYSRENVGKTTDMSAISYSGSVGLGIAYALGKRVSLSVEPRFNYYLNSINKNEAVDYHPYRFGVFTGLNYQF